MANEKVRCGTCAGASEVMNSVGYSSTPVTSGSWAEVGKNRTLSSSDFPKSLFMVTLTNYVRDNNGNIIKRNELTKWRKHTEETKISNLGSGERFTKHYTLEGATVLFYWNLHDSYFAKGIDTPYSIIMKYCPPSENGEEKVNSYINNVCNFLSKVLNRSVGQNTKLSFNETNMKALARIICLIECGKSCASAVDAAWITYKENILNT